MAYLWHTIHIYFRVLTFSICSFYLCINHFNFEYHASLRMYNCINEKLLGPESTYMKNKTNKRNMLILWFWIRVIKYIRTQLYLEMRLQRLFNLQL